MNAPAVNPAEAGSGQDTRPLAGRVVLVVGAHGGLGREASLACAAAGARLVLLGRKVPKLKRLDDAIARAGGEAVLYPLDLEGAGPDDYAQMAGRIHDAFGRLDGLLHCAADMPGLTPLEYTDPAAFARAIHVNLTARWWLTQACLPRLREASDSAVVFTLDDPSRTSQAFWGGYGVAQGAQEALVPMLHAELANTPVRVSALRLRPMRTPLRARAYVEREDPDAIAPAAYAAACVQLLSPAGASRRGTIWAPAIEAEPLVPLPHAGA
ncbi:SDR family NAD(P)-dependent oxidoreductase [Luteimonas sp. JM171]|uniref:SDR family NAD(P)-dependent oxidoreductase n=1 Tax=Luteimonas sp. JM171 TaxID=1896164 RepID=UPI0008579E71|nr:SDR family NAD(P)-dependent oxidoreductase [Luteimonas sp. JM171]AOH34988.1 short-chain dehydrogenase [Luteimonas sp. JM171]